MTFQFDDLGGSDFEGTIDSLPSCQLLGGKKIEDCGIFIRQENAVQAGWIGPTANYEHEFQSGETEKGIWVPNCRMQVIAQSGRWAERCGERTQVLGYYEDNPQLQEQYYDLKEELKGNPDEYVRLRTLFALIFHQPDGEWYHTIPIILSTAGVAAMEFSKAYKAYRSAWEKAVREAQGKKFSPLSDKGRSLCIYDMRFVRGKAGDGSKSADIAVPEFKVEDINAETAQGLTATDKAEDTFALLPAMKNFDQTYFSRFLTAAQTPAQLYGAAPAALPPLDTHGANVLPPVDVANIPY